MIPFETRKPLLSTSQSTMAPRTNHQIAPSNLFKSAFPSALASNSSASRRNSRFMRRWMSIFGF